MPLLLVDDREVHLPGQGGDDQLWLSAASVEAELGWKLRPEGFCRGDVCVPVPRGQEARFARGDDVQVAALWRLLGRPALHDAAGDVWVLGEGAAERHARMHTLEAPDFTLPDLEGRPHTLSDYRGRKVLLVTWASW